MNWLAIQYKLPAEKLIAPGRRQILYLQFGGFRSFIGCWKSVVYVPC